MTRQSTVASAHPVTSPRVWENFSVPRASVDSPSGAVGGIGRVNGLCSAWMVKRMSSWIDSM
ncbi:hypothetical protein ACFQVA_38555 [Actinomadura keratinilytica]